MKALLLKIINRLGGAMPKRLQRSVADFPGVLTLLQKIGRGAFAEVVTPEDTVLVLNPLFHDNLLGQEGIAGYEPEIRQAIITLTRPGDCAYDVGANVGVFSFLFASIVGDRGRVYAFEPEPNNSACLRESIVRNRMRNIVLDQRALGEHPGAAVFDRRGGAFSGRLVGDSDGHRPTTNTITVEAVSIDHMVERQGYRVPDIMKIDVEGNEGMVLAGMKRTFEHAKPTILCELHGHLGDSVDAVHRLLVGIGYRLYSLSDFLADADRVKPLDSVRGVRHIIARWDQ